MDSSAKEWKSRSALTRLPATPEDGVQGVTQRTVGLADLLCYACLTTCTPLTHGKNITSQGVDLPPWVGQRVLESRKVVEREDMKKEIEAFLL